MLPLPESWFDKLTMSGRTDFAQALLVPNRHCERSVAILLGLNLWVIDVNGRYYPSGHASSPRSGT